MFEKCTNCATRVVMGKRDENGIFCSKICQGFYRYPGFCRACDETTTPQSAGSTYTVNGIGTYLYGSKNPLCGMWFDYSNEIFRSAIYPTHPPRQIPDKMDKSGSVP